LCDAEELPASPTSKYVGRLGGMPRKKGLSWQHPTTSGSKEQHRLRQQAVSCGEQSEEEVNAETSLLSHQEGQLAEENVSTSDSPFEVAVITYKLSCFQNGEFSESGHVL
jgi:hypothetical protein